MPSSTQAVSKTADHTPPGPEAPGAPVAVSTHGHKAQLRTQVARRTAKQRPRPAADAATAASPAAAAPRAHTSAIQQWLLIAAAEGEAVTADASRLRSRGSGTPRARALSLASTQLAPRTAVSTQRHHAQCAASAWPAQAELPR